MQSYIDLLKDELADAERRYKASDKEGRPEIAYQIRQIKRDIRRNSMKSRNDRKEVLM
ncbi:MAG: hypothetical protein ACFWUC_07445 [Oscillospiraceae bacterium]|jgi:flagellar biosynthesis protein FlhB